MKIKNNKKYISKAVTITTLGLALFIGVTYAAFTLFTPEPTELDNVPTTSENLDLEPATDEQKAAGSEIKKNALDQNTSGDADTLEVLITSANQNGNTLQIRTDVSGVSNEGLCSLVLSNGTSIISREVGIQAISSSSTCRGFDIPISELSRGNWTINLKVSRASETGSATQTVEIN